MSGGSFAQLKRGLRAAPLSRRTRNPVTLPAGDALHFEKTCSADASHSPSLLSSLLPLFFCSIKALKPVDATTNPSLILAAVTQPKFAELVDTAIKSAKGATADEKCDDGLHHPILGFFPIFIAPCPHGKKIKADFLLKQQNFARTANVFILVPASQLYSACPWQGRGRM